MPFFHGKHRLDNQLQSEQDFGSGQKLSSHIFQVLRNLNVKKLLFLDDMKNMDEVL